MSGRGAFCTRLFPGRGQLKKFWLVAVGTASSSSLGLGSSCFDVVSFDVFQDSSGSCVSQF